MGRGLGIEGVGRGLGDWLAWGRGLGDWRAWGRGLGEWRAGGGASGNGGRGAGPRALWPLACGAPERGLGSARFSRQGSGPQMADLLPARGPPASSPSPPLFTPLVSCSVAARVSGAWCRGSVGFVGSGLQSRGLQPNRGLSALGQHAVSRLGLPGAPSFRAGQRPMSPQAAKETGPHSVSDVKPAPEGPAQGR